MSLVLKFRFRWRADGQEHTAVIEAPNYPTACSKLATIHAAELIRGEYVPADLALDLTKPERVEA